MIYSKLKAFFHMKNDLEDEKYEDLCLIIKLKLFYECFVEDCKIKWFVTKLFLVGQF